MGREKRIAESRAKEILESKKAAAEGRRSGPAPAAAAPAPPPVAAAAPVAAIPPAEHTGTAKALLQIVALYLVPVALMLIVGKLLLRL